MLDIAGGILIALLIVIGIVIAFAVAIHKFNLADRTQNKEIARDDRLQRARLSTREWGH